MWQQLDMKCDENSEIGLGAILERVQVTKDLQRRKFLITVV